jgi:hypothetical protein
MYKVHDAAGKYQAACKEPEACAALLGSLYPNGTVRHAGLVVYRDHEGGSGESYDGTARAILGGIVPARRAAYDRQHGAGAAARLLEGRK